MNFELTVEAHNNDDFILIFIKENHELLIGNISGSQRSPIWNQIWNRNRSSTESSSCDSVFWVGATREKLQLQAEEHLNQPVYPSSKWERGVSSNSVGTFILEVLIDHS